MKLRHIEVFHAYRCMLTGTVNGAARLLNVTQPAVTKISCSAPKTSSASSCSCATKAVSSRPPKPTCLFGEATKIFAGLDNMRSIARNLRSAGGHSIHMAAPPAFCLGLIPAVVAAFSSEMPETAVEVHLRITTPKPSTLCCARMSSSRSPSIPRIIRRSSSISSRRRASSDAFRPPPPPRCRRSSISLVAFAAMEVHRAERPRSDRHRRQARHSSSPTSTLPASIEDQHQCARPCPRRARCRSGDHRRVYRRVRRAAASCSATSIRR